MNKCVLNRMVMIILRFLTLTALYSHTRDDDFYIFNSNFNRKTNK